MHIPKPIIPKPLKPKFRYSKPRPRLTTVIAVQCKDSVVLCSEAQETTTYFGGLETKQPVSKIFPVSCNDKTDPNCLLGCAGNDTRYIDRFRENVGEEFFKHADASYYDMLDKATRTYSQYVVTRSREIGLKLEDAAFPSAIFVGYDPKSHATRVYFLHPPELPHLLSKHPYRVTIGTGELYASFIFSIAERLMGKVPITWRDLSTTVVAQFCYMLMMRIMAYDGSSGLYSDFYRVDEKGHSLLTVEQIFHGQPTKQKYRLSILLETLLKELPHKRVVELAEQYDIAGIIAGLLSEK